MILCALPPFYASGESKKAERLITVLIGGAEIVLCGIVLEGSAASYAMIGLMILFCAFEIVSLVRDSRSLRVELRACGYKGWHVKFVENSDMRCRLH